MGMGMVRSYFGSNIPQTALVATYTYDFAKKSDTFWSNFCHYFAKYCVSTIFGQIFRQFVAKESDTFWPNFQEEQSTFLWQNCQFSVIICIAKL
jgi:hypothetical protein